MFRTHLTKNGLRAGKAMALGLIRFRGHPTKGGYRGKDGTPNEDTKGQAHIH